MALNFEAKKAVVEQVNAVAMALYLLVLLSIAD